MRPSSPGATSRKGTTRPRRPGPWRPPLRRTLRSQPAEAPTVTVSVTNLGGQQVTSTDVTLFNGGQQLAATTVGPLAPQAQTSATFQWTAPALAQTVTLVAVVNSAHSPNERSFDNNR